MSATQLLYLQDFTLLTCDAKVIEVLNENEHDILILDQTVFYPQGGGQPYDQGKITTVAASFVVNEVRLLENAVRHIGKFEKNHIEKSTQVKCQVDAERRMLNNKLHSAGHVVDLAVQELKLGWVPGKGYHFPSGPYVEYAGNLANLDKEKLKTEIEALCNRFIQENIKTKVMFVDKEKLSSLCHFIPAYLPSDQPVRLILFGDFAIPCGGTHVAHLGEIRSLRIRKIKMESGNIRVSYDIAR